MEIEIAELEELCGLVELVKATIVIFDHDLTPAQIRNIERETSCKIIDRSELILDIFAQRAQSRDGKLQVELAQMKYLLPRLGQKDDALSRLTGGIGGRGPGETKLEIGRRRARERITRLGKQLKKLGKQRKTRRSRRGRRGVKVVAIVGYTNAGKSTLLNTLTQADVLAEDKLFATLDTRSRRAELPSGNTIVMTDTVGFIQKLPTKLVSAFRATLEELQEASLILHVVDSSSALARQQVWSVQSIIEELEAEEEATRRERELEAQRTVGLLGLWRRGVRI